VTAAAAPAHRRRRRRRRVLLVAASLTALLLAFGCTSTITPPPAPTDPTTIFVLREAMHTGLVLPPQPGHAEYVEFGYGDWSWFALGNDAWYHAFATVLWPTRGALGRRSFGANTEAELKRTVHWATLSPVVVSRERAGQLRERLEREFAAGQAEVVRRQDLGFVFVPSQDSYWFGYNCADAAAVWLRELDCSVSWVPIRIAVEP
jgi:Protein of unknown function (DUF2459)